MESRAQTATTPQAAVWAKKRKEQVERAQRASRRRSPSTAWRNSRPRPPCPQGRARRARELGRMSTGSSIAPAGFVNVAVADDASPSRPASSRGALRRACLLEPDARPRPRPRRSTARLPPRALAGCRRRPRRSAHECGVCGKRFSSANVLASHVRGARRRRGRGPTEVEAGRSRAGACSRRSRIAGGGCVRAGAPATIRARRDNEEFAAAEVAAAAAAAATASATSHKEAAATATAAASKTNVNEKQTARVHAPPRVQGDRARRLNAPPDGAAALSQAPRAAALPGALSR